MCKTDVDSTGTLSDMESNTQIGELITGVLAQARSEQRLICGLIPSITYLDGNPDGVLICLMADTRPGDSAGHMHAVLLQAFCNENDIPVLTVDSDKRLAELCGQLAPCSCAIISHDPEVLWPEQGDPPLTPEEKSLQHYYEFASNQYPRPVIELPI